MESLYSLSIVGRVRTLDGPARPQDLNKLLPAHNGKTLVLASSSKMSRWYLFPKAHLQMDTHNFHTHQTHVTDEKHRVTGGGN